MSSATFLVETDITTLICGADPADREEAWWGSQSLAKVVCAGPGHLQLCY